MSWQVGASAPPPQDVITGFGREILITEITREGKPMPQPKLVASAKTQQYMRAEASSSASSQGATTVDPWTLPGKDPWKTTSAPKAAPTGKSHLQEVTGHLKEELTVAMRQKFEELSQNHIVTEDFEGQQANNLKRFQQIENSLGEMQAQQLKFSGWFTSIGQQVQATEASIQGIQYTLSTHQADLQGLHHEVKGVSEQVGQAVHNALQNHKTEVASDFDARFDRLEALFSKKHRSE